MAIKHAGGMGTAVLCAVAALAPAAAQAGPAQGAALHRVTINVQPKPLVAGEPALIYGRLFGPNRAGRVVNLFHRVAFQNGFSFVQRTKTDANGAYEFPRADGVVTTSRSWYVRSVGARSRSVFEPVQAQLTLQGPPDGSNLLTGPAHPYTFSGTVSPGTVGARIVLQRQSASIGNDDWHTIGEGRVGPGGAFTITHRFIVPGDANIRVHVAGNRRNAASDSSPLAYQISQAQNPSLTINASADPLMEGQSVTISGTLANGANQPVTLLAHADRQGFAPVAVATTDASGNYSFAPQTPVNSTYYQVSGAGKRSAVLYEGVRDVLTASASASTVPAGQPVTFSGSVSPQHSGHVIYLQRQNAKGGDFHIVAVSFVATGSTYTITKPIYDSGVFRVYIPGGPENQGAASQPFAITVRPTGASAITPTQG